MALSNDWKTKNIFCVSGVGENSDICGMIGLIRTNPFMGSAYEWLLANAAWSDPLLIMNNWNFMNLVKHYMTCMTCDQYLNVGW